MGYKIISLMLLMILIAGCSTKPMIEQPAEEQILDDQPGMIATVNDTWNETDPAPEEDNALDILKPTDVEVSLTAEKTMVPSQLTIRKGTTVRFRNDDGKQWNHNLLIHFADVKVSGPDDMLAQSGNIAPGDSWEYTFSETATYTIKDIYSGTMRGEITAEVTRKAFMETYEQSDEVGKIIVK